MKISRYKIGEADIQYALNPNPWDLGNDVLYRLCKEHPNHKTEQEIIAKIWLIGRSYAAAIERRKTKIKGESSDNFYESTVVDSIKGSEIDKRLAALPPYPTNPQPIINDVLQLQQYVTNLFTKMTGLEKRSLASKYLHFHRPDLFFIYDSRARTGISAVTPRMIPRIINGAEPANKEYLMFCNRCLWLQNDIRQKFGKELKPRELDRILLRVFARRKLIGV